jgi:hypothetical protein
VFHYLTDPELGVAYHCIYHQKLLIILAYRVSCGIFVFHLATLNCTNFVAKALPK